MQNVLLRAGLVIKYNWTCIIDRKCNEINANIVPYFQKFSPGVIPPDPLFGASSVPSRQNFLVPIQLRPLKKHTQVKTKPKKFFPTFETFLNALARLQTYHVRVYIKFHDFFFQGGGAEFFYL